MSDYYKPRWQLFIQYLQKSLTHKTPFNQNNFNEEVYEKVELKFVNDVKLYSSEPNGSYEKFHFSELD
jgi:alpha-N-acetylglucosaminidase